MNAGHHGTRRPAMVASGLAALAAVAAIAPASAATTRDDGDPTSGNRQVALVNETNAQPPGTKSKLNGTANVTSYDGSTVVFSTEAALVPSDTNQTDDVYLRDDGTTVLVSSRRQKPGNDASFEPTISDDGRYVAFTTAATNLTGARDTNGHTLDVVVKDMQTDTITLVSQSTAGFQRAKNSFFPVISGNGRHVAFQTFGVFSRLEDDRHEDVYVRDTRRGTTKQASLLPGAGRDVRGGVLVGDVSDDGRIVTFGDNRRLWARDMRAKETVRFWQEPGSAPCQPFPIGSAGRPVVSGNGKYVAFSSCAEDLPGSHDFTQVVRIALATGEIDVLTAGNGHSFLPSLSRSGRFVGFGSEASDLVAGDTEGQPDAFRFDTETGEVQRSSQGPDGAGGNSLSATSHVAISGDGHSLAYTSYSDNLVVGDESDYEEAFVWRD